ncbi:MAG: DNA-binding protein [Proteobacteria bacterium]|nr:DNA-binding protein [Pseudomonadota bacterium]
MSGRFFSVIIVAIILNGLLAGTVFAGFWGSDDTGKSGLDFSNGYDINTVSTMSGRAISLPYRGEKANVFIEIKSGNQNLNVSVGPGSYWKQKGIVIALNDELTVKGSKAQGKDGKVYILAQKIVNRTTGSQMDVRNDKGEPGWSGQNNYRPEHFTGGMRTMGGSMMRSGGGMMRR